jgi:hypothetical protein
MKKSGTPAKSARKAAAAGTKAASGTRSGVSLRPIVDAIHGVERAVRQLPVNRKRAFQDEALLKFLTGLAQLAESYCFQAHEPFDVLDPYIEP